MPEIFLAGIDGSGKTTLVNSLISRLEHRYRIFSNGSVHFKGNNKRLLKINFGEIIYRLKQRTPGSRPLVVLFSLLNFPLRCLEAAYFKRHANIDLLLYETDAVLHPAAFVAFYCPWIKQLSHKVRFKMFHTLFGPGKNSLTLYLDTDPRTACDRIASRNSPVDPHENPVDLERLKREFDDLVWVASNNKLEVVKIDNNNKAVEAVVREIEIILKTKLAVSCEGADGFAETSLCRETGET